MRNHLRWLGVAWLFASAGALLGAEPTPEQVERLTSLLAGKQLTGYFTLVDATGAVRGETPDGPPKLDRERYEITEVKPLASGRWLLKTRITYGTRDVTLPLALPVEWVGETPMVVVDNIGFPGLGTYSARVLFHGDRYSGVWQGDGYGGHLFGTIAPLPPAEATESEAPSATPPSSAGP